MLVVDADASSVIGAADRRTHFGKVCRDFRARSEEDRRRTRGLLAPMGELQGNAAAAAAAELGGGDSRGRSDRTDSCGDSPAARGASRRSSTSASPASRRCPSSPNRRWLRSCRLKQKRHIWTLRFPPRGRAASPPRSRTPPLAGGSRQLAPAGRPLATVRWGATKEEHSPSGLSLGLQIAALETERHKTKRFIARKCHSSSGTTDSPRAQPPYHVSSAVYPFLCIEVELKSIRLKCNPKKAPSRSLEISRQTRSCRPTGAQYTTVRIESPTSVWSTSGAQPPHGRGGTRLPASAFKIKRLLGGATLVYWSRTDLRGK